MNTGIPIDVTNPDDIRAKLPELEDLIRSRKRELDKLDAMADKLAAVAGVKRQRPKSKGGARVKARPKRKTSRMQVKEIIEKIGRPATVAEVTEKTNPPLKQKTAGWALWKEAQEGAINAFKNGMYAPLGYTPNASELVPPDSERGDSP
jgi:hypothetical protein